ncbi:MAG: copper-binding protein [Rhodocyclales bacterium]|nr:copper-binding protein [Rhodocyclales bacterium]
MKQQFLPMLLAALVLPAYAADHAGHAMPHTVAAADKVQLAEGTIKKMNKAAGKVTLAHGPIENIGMGAMTMAFKVKEPKQLDAFKPGDKVRFQADYVGGEMVVTHIEAAR